MKTLILSAACGFLLIGHASGQTLVRSLPGVTPPTTNIVKAGLEADGARALLNHTNIPAPPLPPPTIRPQTPKPDVPDKLKVRLLNLWDRATPEQKLKVLELLED